MRLETKMPGETHKQATIYDQLGYRIIFFLAFPMQVQFKAASVATVRNQFQIYSDNVILCLHIAP